MEMGTPSLEKPRHTRRSRRAGTGSGATEHIIIVLLVALVGVVAVRKVGTALGGRYTETAKCVAEMTTTNGECRPQTTGDLPDLPDPLSAAAPASRAGPKAPGSAPPPEPTVCETEFEGGNCRKVSCPGGVLPEPGTFESPCCGPGFAIVSLSRPEKGDPTAECCPSTTVCGPPPPDPGAALQCEPDLINCRSPGPRRECPPLTILAKFSPGGRDVLLCCRDGFSCAAIGRSPPTR